MASAMATETDIRPDSRTLPVDTDGDHDRYAHYVKKADIVRANITGEPVEALCGKKWIPNRDPERYPVCPTCKEILASRRS